ncbi:putative alpha,alpha-trehalose-phosphate synthase subunit [Podosphaera aphanis]|nr:putative alpha,alpha-trehalose-phosphate synthase subunit [Podosphaera aphanis]
MYGSVGLKKKPPATTVVILANDIRGMMFITTISSLYLTEVDTCVGRKAPDRNPSQPTLFVQAPDPTPSQIPAIQASQRNEQCLSQDSDPVAPAKSFNQGEFAPNHPLCPEWGSNTGLNQPQSTASSPPPACILKYNKSSNRKFSNLGSLGKVNTHQSQLGQNEIHDRDFAQADWTVVSSEQGNGGLRNAVQAAVRNGKLDNKLWVGTLGMPTDALEGTEKKQEIKHRLLTEFDSLAVFCKDSDFNGHYTHYSKQILWPVFHYQIPDNPKSKAYEDHSWIYYVKVNQAFADKIVQNWKLGDVIWIHDYHLLLVPRMIRQQLPEAKIGFFLHVAFPSSEVFRCLAVRKELLEGMLGANLIGFQIHQYARHFLQTCSRLLCVEAVNEGVQLEDRFVAVINLAIGIDPVALDMNREDPDVSEWVKILRERYQDKKLIVARDKLDHVRGVRSKLLSYELFLNKYPEWRDKAVMIQVATSTTEQAELDATVSDIVTRVNSEWANLAYQPLLYLKQDISYAQYLALLTVADCLMITSQREGMNLTCHEFLFCQDGRFQGHNKHGCLILSEFTGSAFVFGGNELSVNPWDYRQCADSIKTALEMGEDEKQNRWNKLYKAVMHHTAEYWFTSFLEKLDQIYDDQHLRNATSIPRLSVDRLVDEYKNSENRLFILDYEGTLASWGSPNHVILTSQQRTLDVLNDLLLAKGNTVYVMSGRQPEELEQLFKRVPNLGFIAENGCYIKMFGSSEWIENADPEEMRKWKESVEGIMHYYHERTPGSWIETRNCSLIFHYTNCEDQESANRLAGDCASHINDACEAQRVRAHLTEGAVVVEPIDWSKGTAAETIFDFFKETLTRDNQDASLDFLMVAGNNRDDEVVFHWANELGEKSVKNVTTITLGSRNTEAGFTLTQGVTGLLSVLQKLVKMT